MSLALVSLVLSQEATAQPGSNNQPTQEMGERARQAVEELLVAVRLYKNGDFAGAQRHSERALELDPEQKNAPAFIARSIHAQYRVGVETPENIAKAHEAIAAYQRILDRWPANDEAFNAIGFLYGAIKEDENQIEWIKRRTLDSSVSLEKRSDAYTFLASKDWDCSFKVTEDTANKDTVEVRGKTIIRFKMPENREDFDRAALCTSRGLEETEMAINLNPNNEKAWGYKTNLLLEARKLAEMEGKMRKAARLSREADEAQRRTSELLMIRKREAGQPQNPATGP
jgi:tetratricopeptide (TPR) repeat protein